VCLMQQLQDFLEKHDSLINNFKAQKVGKNINFVVIFKILDMLARARKIPCHVSSNPYERRSNLDTTYLGDRLGEIDIPDPKHGGRQRCGSKLHRSARSICSACFWYSIKANLDSTYICPCSFTSYRNLKYFPCPKI
jgi:hypothetical protein